MNPSEAAALEALRPFLDDMETAVLVIMAVFTRISAIVFLLPGVGERMISIRIKLIAAVAFAIVTWPLIPVDAKEAGFALKPTLTSLGYALVAEAIAGLILGFSIRLLIFAIQTAGMIAAQSLSISQIFGGVSADPEPTIATLLTLAAIALALNLGLHIKAVSLIAISYQILPLGVFPAGADVAAWTASRYAQAFGLAVSLALPFLVISFGYNLALGFINRAMPQMMVAFVGLPAITWAGILLLMVVSSAILTTWSRELDAAFLAPLALRI
ncbi:MAG: flagellar biosynthetic protein FliR [Pseudomonadota bacterium]